MDKRIRFSKTGILKFIGHLDLLRTFQRAFRRAEIPLAYSKGFNPHPLMSFANPLGLGLTSDDEYADITLEQAMDSSEIIDRLNRQMPPGLSILACYDLPEHGDSAMALVTASEYIITLPDLKEDNASWSSILTGFFSQPQIMIRKMGKVRGRKQMMEVDVKDLVYEYELTGENTLRLLCACGSTKNLKTDSLLESLYKFIDRPELLFEEAIHRTRLFQGEPGSFRSLTDGLIGIQL